MRWVGVSVLALPKNAFNAAVLSSVTQKQQALRLPAFLWLRCATLKVLLLC
jgi:hypothetical protein